MAGRARQSMGMTMFFVVKSVFWLSVVALAMPGGEIEARKAGAAVVSLARLAAPAAALIADQPASAGAGCLAANQCRAALTQLIQATLAQDDYADRPVASAPGKPRAGKPGPAARQQAARPS